MNTNSNKQQSQLIVETAFSATNNDFNFEKWASQVRRQMIKSLEKRQVKRKTK